MSLSVDYLFFVLVEFRTEQTTPNIVHRLIDCTELVTDLCVQQKAIIMRSVTTTGELDCLCPIYRRVVPSKTYGSSNKCI